MKVIRFFAGALVFSSMVGNANSAPAAQGVISITGRVFAAGCDVSGRPGGVMTLADCPSASRGTIISARNVQPIASVAALEGAAAEVSIVQDSDRNQRYYDQQYVLVSKAGTPIDSGTYLITLTSP